VSSQGVVAVEHLDEVRVNFITLDEFGAIKLFGDNVKDLFISRVFNLKEVGVHGCVSGTNVVLHGGGGCTRGSVPLHQLSQGLDIILKSC